MEENKQTNVETSDSNRKQELNKAKKADKKEKSQIAQTIRFVIILILVAGVVLGVYLRMTNNSKNSNKQAEENMSEVEILKLYNFETQYPKSARDVVKMHCRILKCMYNEDFDEKEYEEMNRQARKLFAATLLEANPEEQQLSNLLDDVNNFRSAGKIFISYTVYNEDTVKYSKVDGVEYAMVRVSCNIRKGTVTDALEEEYLLCKEDGQWKIVGWQGFFDGDETE